MQLGGIFFSGVTDPETDRALFLMPRSPIIVFYLSFVGTKKFLVVGQFITSTFKKKRGRGHREKGKKVQCSEYGVLQHKISLSHKSAKNAGRNLSSSCIYLCVTKYLFYITLMFFKVKLSAFKWYLYSVLSENCPVMNTLFSFK